MRFMHTMLRVGNLDRSIDFYTNVLGMKLLSKKDFPDGQFTIAFVGYDAKEVTATLELTYNYGTERYELGTAYGHIAIGVADVYEACKRFAAAGANITRPAGPMKNG